MRYYHLQFPSGEVLLSNVSKTDSHLFETCEIPNEIVQYGGTRLRRGKKTGANGMVFFGGTAEYVSSNRLFKEQFLLLEELLQFVTKQRQEKKELEIKYTERLLHNIVTHNAHCIQEVYDFVPEQELSNHAVEQATKIQEYIKRDSRKAAVLLQRLLKYNSLIKKEISIFDKLYVTNPKLDTRRHNIHRVIHSVLHYFYNDFNEIGVFVKVYLTDKVALFDYDSFAVVLTHILENAVKYVQPNTEIEVYFELKTEELIVSFDMMSCRIELDEVEQIFLEGYSGKWAEKLGSKGKGIGMYVVRQLIELNGGRIAVRPNIKPSRNVKIGSAEYENNLFDLVLPTT